MLETSPLNSTVAGFFSPSEPGVKLQRINLLAKTTIALLANAYFKSGGSWVDWRMLSQDICDTTERAQGVIEEAQNGSQTAILQIAHEIGVPVEMVTVAFSPTNPMQADALANMTIAELLSVLATTGLAEGSGAQPQT